MKGRSEEEKMWAKRTTEKISGEDVSATRVKLREGRRSVGLPKEKKVIKNREEKGAA